MKTRCDWTKDDALMNAYHDKEWGVPVHNDKKHFEFLVLDAFQAGLSWKTILYRREGFRNAFADFNVEKVARFDENKIQKLLLDENPLVPIRARIIRNRLKIYGTVKNAKAFISVQEEFDSFNKFIWQFVNHQTITNKWKSLKDIPATSKESDAMSKELKKRGFTFVGSTICYAYMQAAGLVNDHLESCFRHKVLK